MNAAGFHGAQAPVRRFSGAWAVRVSHPARQRIHAHDHAWACLTLPLMGSCLERHEMGEDVLVGAAAALHAPGALHEDEIGDAGFETLSIQFDPAWLDQRGLRHSYVWSGVQVAGMRRLQRLWRDRRVSEAVLAEQTASFILNAMATEAGEAPRWLSLVHANLEAGAPKNTRELADEIGVSPARVAEAYRIWAGEGLAEALMRRRVERAVLALQASDAPLAEIAASAGFCDQAHMNRCFRRVLDRTPTQMRRAS